MDLGIAGRKAAVAAASAGLGLGSARALVGEGVQVAICGRDQQRLDDAVADLGAGSLGIRADLSDPDDARRFVRTASAELGGLDILVTNTGGPTPGPWGSVDVDQYRDAIDLVLLSAIAMCEEAVPTMRESGWGRVVAITSMSVRQPIPNLITSNTVRAGLTGYLKTMATEVAPDGVTVNSIQPGSHATDRMIQLTGGHLDAAAAQIPVGFLGDPDDFGAVVAFLCSEQARFITGEAVLVDGGVHGGLQ
jgi:3-oxoacyl-[acyl-carrier protein] reductase